MELHWKLKPSSNKDSLYRGPERQGRIFLDFSKLFIVVDLLYDSRT